ncbi:MAG: response regulator [Sulfitobacter sp.]|nr:response regulator [Sulfitobacter sp.]
MKILAVDDDPIILELLGEFMALVGQHELTKAQSAHEAIDILRSTDAPRFDCFLFDIQMPGMDGVELTQTLRATKRFADVPILMLTAMAEKRYVDSAFAAGATDYITKPFEIAELTARIRSVEELIARRKARNGKVFAAQSVADQTNVIELFEPISIYDVDNVIEYLAMENYIAQLSRSALFGSTTIAFTVREIEAFHTRLSPFEFYSLISDVAEVISDTLQGNQFLMAYAGNGTFVCVTESGWRPDPVRLQDAVNLSLSRTELYDNSGQRLEPRVCAGEAIRLIWKSGDSVMEALATAHASAEAACVAFEKSKYNLWNMGQTA